MLDFRDCFFQQFQQEVIIFVIVLIKRIITINDAIENFIVDLKMLVNYDCCYLIIVINEMIAYIEKWVIKNQTKGFKMVVVIINYCWRIAYQ